MLVSFAIFAFVTAAILSEIGKIDQAHEAARAQVDTL